MMNREWFVKYRLLKELRRKPGCALSLIERCASGKRSVILHYREVYPLLRKMHVEGNVSVYDENPIAPLALPRRGYIITQHGIDELDRMEKHCV